MIENYPRIMLVDMNSFFASVEQQANPRLRGKPLGVSPSSHKNSCLIGTSKEAKAMGIKNGVPLYMARKICPEIIVVESEPEKYREVNRQINRIFSDYTNSLEAYSVDESFLDLSESKLNPLLVGAEIKSRIKAEVGEWLTCSVGIAPNKFMAKLAADLKKPDGLSVVWRSNLPEIYKKLKFSDLWGVAHGWQKRLNSLGLVSPLDLWNYPVANLLAVFGKPGFYIWQRINGLEQDEISSREDRPKSFGHSWVLNFRTADKERLKIAIMRLAEKAARRMRREKFKARGIYLSVTDVTGAYFHVSKKLKRTIKTGQELYEEAMNLWKNWEFHYEIMHIAIGFGSLLDDCHQLDLFGDKSPFLIKALDAINDRYGEFTIRSGLLTQTSDFAPDAIAFGR
jgi:DNA polymerase-4